MTAGQPRQLAIGAAAPAFALPDLRGETVTLDALCALGKPVLLLFSSPDCPACHAVLPDLGQWQHQHTATFTLALISQGSHAANREQCLKRGITRVLLQQRGEVADSYAVPATPSALVVRPDGTIGSELVIGAAGIRALVSELTGQPEPARTPLTIRSIGEPAPAFALPDLDGTLIHHTDLRGQPTLLLFWRPSCPYCQRMLDRLRAWDRARAAGQPRLLLISSSTVEVNRSLGLRSTIVLDQRSQTARLFGVKGTPRGDGRRRGPYRLAGDHRAKAILTLATQVAG